MSGFYLMCDGTTKIVELPKYLRFKDYHTIAEEWTDLFGIACSWTQPNSLLSGNHRRLVMLVNTEPKTGTQINLAIQEMLDIPIRGPVLLFVTDPFHSRSSKEKTRALNMTLEECQSYFPFLLSCFEVLDTEHNEETYYWLAPGFKSGVRKDPEKLTRLRSIADKLEIRDSRLN